jgi:MFS family permease
MSSTEPDRPDRIAGEENSSTDSGSDPGGNAAPSAAILATYGSLLAVFSSGLIWQVAAAGLNLYIPLRMALGGQSPTDIGFVTAAYSLGFLVGSYYSAYPVRRVGHIRAFAIAAALQCTLTLLFIASGDGQHWLLPRFVMGVTGACLAVVDRKSVV